MTLKVPIYSEQPITADALRIIQQVLQEYPPGTFEFDDLTVMMQGQPPYQSPMKPVIVFGSSAKFGVQFSIPWQLIHTYSMAQLVTKANAASVLKAALDQFYVPQKQHPTSIIWGNLGRLDPDKPMAVDIETSGNLDTDTPDEVGIISVCFYQDGKWAKWVGDQHFCDLACSVLCKREVDDIVFTAQQKQILSMIKYGIYHNGKFDLRVIEARTGVRMNMYFDTMLAHHALNQAAGQHALKPLCRQYLGAPEWEGNLSTFTVGGGHYENIPRYILTEYNGWDVYWTYELWRYLEPQLLADEQLLNVFWLEMSASDMLLDVEQFGFAVDVPYLQGLETTMIHDVDILKRQLQAHITAEGVVFVDSKGQVKKVQLFNPGSWQQVQQVISHLNGVAYTASTDEKTLKKLQANSGRKLRNFIDMLLDYRGETKALSTYVQGALKRQRNGRVHTTFLIQGTSTGRLSSASPNIQNIPRDKKYRSIYIG